MIDAVIIISEIGTSQLNNETFTVLELIVRQERYRLANAPVAPRAAEESLERPE